MVNYARIDLGSILAYVRVEVLASACPYAGGFGRTRPFSPLCMPRMQGKGLGTRLVHSVIPAAMIVSCQGVEWGAACMCEFGYLHKTEDSNCSTFHGLYYM